MPGSAACALVLLIETGAAAMRVSVNCGGACHRELQARGAVKYVQWSTWPGNALVQTPGGYIFASFVIGCSHKDEVAHTLKVWRQDSAA